MDGSPLSVASPWALGVACTLAVAAAALATVRRPALPRLTLIAAGAGVILLALAAGGITWHRPAAAEVAVMVDLSASTRGAAYRDRAQLDRRIRELLGATPYRITCFSDHVTPTAPAGDTLPDLPGERTVFSPPAAPAILLFSDGRFSPPAASPPVFAVADPNLDQPDDAAVSRLELRGNQLVAQIANTGPPRRLTMDAAATRPATTVDTGGLTFVAPIKPDATSATAVLARGDRWPENDRLTLPIAPAARSERWWISTKPAPTSEWRTIRLDVLPADPAAYLAPSVIALDDLAAGDLSAAQQAALEQYVRDLGGALLIGGGAHAFGQGGYDGSALGALAPLASSPPTPSVHWVLLADASGSMSQSVGQVTRWQLAASAIARLLPVLPPEDPVSVGSFAAELTWWSTGKSARQTSGLALPPPDVSPNGPTNLAAALDRVARESDGGLATELLVVSDADVTIDEPAALADRLKQKKIRLHLLAIGDGRGVDALRIMTAATGGTLRRQLDPRQWAAEARQLLTAAWPDRLVRTPINVHFTGDLATLPARDAAPWNRTWLKSAAIPLASGDAAGERVALVARWNVGAGEVVACAFIPAPTEITAIARLIARPPRDPRLTVTWDTGPRLRVRVDAAERGRPINDLSLRLEIADEREPTRVEPLDIPQTAPGRYERSVDAPRVPSFATLRRDAATVVDRAALPGRYAPEFDAVGNDYDALSALANRTGGRVIDRAWTKPLDLPFPRRDVPLAPWLSLAAAIALAGGLTLWRAR